MKPKYKKKKKIRFYVTLKFQGRNRAPLFQADSDGGSKTAIQPYNYSKLCYNLFYMFDAFIGSWLLMDRMSIVP